MKSFITNYLYLLKHQKPMIFALVCLFIFSSLLDILSVGLIGPFISMIATPEAIIKMPFLGWVPERFPDQKEQIIFLGTMLIVLTVGKTYISYFVQKMIFKFVFNYRASLVSRMIDAYLHMPYRFYLERNSAESINSILTHTKVVGDDLLIPSLRSVSNIIILVSVISFLCYIQWESVVCLTLIFLVVIAVYTMFIKPVVRQAGKDFADSNEKTIKGVNQGINGIKEVRVLAAERQFYKEVSEAAKLSATALTRFYINMALPKFLLESALVIFIVLFTIVMVIVQNIEGAAVVPILAMFGMAGLRVLPAATELSSSIACMTYSTHSVDTLTADLRMIDELEEKPDEDRASSVIKRDQGFESLELNQVQYTYPKMSKPAIKDLSMKVSRGESIGIIGESGSGKTTLVDILLGLHPFSSGDIIVNEKNIKQVGWDWWRSKIAYIPQTVFLIDDTLVKNIAFGIDLKDVDLERLNKCVEDAHLTEFIKKAPDGLQTVVGDGGIRMSGGERQRIALARAFYHDRDVLIFDEATSALDNNTEKHIIEVIESLHGKKTLIVIAHRMSTVKHCDTIYQLNQGTVVSKGSYDTVVNK